MSNKKSKNKKLNKTLALKTKKRSLKGNLTRFGIKGGILVAIIGGFALWLLWGIPLPTELSKSPAVSTKIFDRNGTLLYEIYAQERRTPLKLDTIPKHVIDATIAIEDKDFYNHYGFSPTGIGRAAYKIVFRQKVEGGSTLTQQLVKNSLLTPERTLKRKLREFVLATLVEIRYPKDRILELYLNQIPYGSTAYGIGTAAELYFNKSAQDLTLAESALLAGLPAAPTRYSPFGVRPEFARERQKQVLRRMVEDGYITQEESDKAYEQELQFAEPEDLKAPHFVLWVREQLAEKYGEAVVEQGGLRVTTTLDLTLQDYAQEVVKTEVDRLEKQSVGNGAAVVVRPGSGEILAMVGSKDYNATDEDGKVNVILASRQPGSSIKPLNYALALKDRKIAASTPLADIPTCFSVSGQKPYCPRNYDGGFHGATQVRFALGNSYNIPAVRVLALNGLDNFVNFSTQMGITTFKDPSNYGLSLTLGGGEVRPVDMAEAFSVFANQGVRIPLISILRVEDWSGKVYHKADVNNRDGIRILEPGVAFIISHILKDNGARTAAFGTGSQLVVRGHPEVSVKTGTTNDLRDNWTIGYTGHVAVVTWVGNNDFTPMSGAVSGVSGASPIWNRIMSYALERAESGEFNPNDTGHAEQKPPSDVRGVNVCSHTGTVPQEVTGGCPTRFEYFLTDHIPTGGAIKKAIFVNKEANEEASEETPPDKVEAQEHLYITDPLGTLICLDCPFPMPTASIRYPLSR